MSKCTELTCPHHGAANRAAYEALEADGRVPCRHRMTKAQAEYDGELIAWQCFKCGEVQSA